MKIWAMVLSPCATLLVLILTLLASPGLASGQDDCRLDCPPRDDHEFLQAILDRCPPGSICRLPEGTFTLSAPLQIRTSMHIQGAGGGPRKSPGKPVTEIRVAEGTRLPAFAIEAEEGDIEVSIRDAALVGGGIQAGGRKDPCRGIDDPFDLFEVNLSLLDMTILASVADAIRFEGTSLSLDNVDVSGSVDGTGLYVAKATGDVVVIDAQFVGHERWGVYICTLEGTGQIFMNDVSASQNGRGGVAIVGKGTPPGFRTACVQNTGAAFNARFGVLLVDVAKTLLFNVQAGFTFSQADGRFGDGIAVSASDDVVFWDVTTALNERAGFSAFGPDASQPSHIHLVGNIEALDNVLNAAAEGHAALDPHTGPTTVFGVCGLTAPITAPPLDAYCEQNLNPVNCSAVAVGLEPPDGAP